MNLAKSYEECHRIAAPPTATLLRLLPPAETRADGLAALYAFCALWTTLRTKARTSRQSSAVLRSGARLSIKHHRAEQLFDGNRCRWPRLCRPLSALPKSFPALVDTTCSV